MTLDQFVAEEHIRLDRFLANYHRNAIERQHEWPLEMEPGDWDEQLQCFSE